MKKLLYTIPLLTLLVARICLADSAEIPNPFKEGTVKLITSKVEAYDYGGSKLGIDKEIKCQREFQKMMGLGVEFHYFFNIKTTWCKSEVAVNSKSIELFETGQKYLFMSDVGATLEDGLFRVIFFSPTKELNNGGVALLYASKKTKNLTCQFESSSFRE